MPKQRLGQGLSALIKNYAEEDERPLDANGQQKSNGSILEMSIDDIVANPNQPRKDFREDALNDLIASIASKGLVQPITVRPFGDKYEIIAGERRYRACKQLGKTSIPAYVLNITSDVDAMELALVENLQRDNLNPLEEAEAYSLLSGKYNLSHEEIGDHLGKSRASISNTMRLLKLPPEIKLALKNMLISAGHARALVGVQDSRLMLHLFRRVLRDKLNVRETETLINKTKEQPARSTPAKKASQKPRNIISIEEKIMEKLGTKVLVHQKKEKGIIEIEYFSQEDLDRLVEIFESIELS